MKSRLEELYNTKIKFELQKELDLQNVMQIPKISKMVLNIGAKDAVTDNKVINGIKQILSNIAGQCAVSTKAKKSIAGFKVREGMAIGTMVTLRGTKMYHFLDKLINVVLPAVRDFQGTTTNFDDHGNYNLGIKDWMVFPEVDYDKIDKSRGMNITIQTTALSKGTAQALLKKFNMPFRKKMIA
jgi:large subunit ribosomal protein L5